MTTPHHDATLRQLHEAQQVGFDLARQLEADRHAERRHATLARSLLSRLHMLETHLLETPHKPRVTMDQALAMDDDVELIGEEGSEVLLHQMVQEYAPLLEFLYADNGSWEAVGRLLGHIVDQAKSHP